ncbi:MAG TPA: creatininase family protein [Burkholderiaceae bacterium]|nr:creatininase family protein [Burkholderiaceae bacterium]
MRIRRGAAAGLAAAALAIGGACATFGAGSATRTADPAAPLPGASVLLEDLTWTELRARIAAGATTAIVPVGGTEQSGPAIALGKHNARVKVLSERIARDLGNAIVAPVIAYVPEGSIEPPAAHMRFPGTLSVPDDVFERTLEAAGRSLKSAGFLDVVFLGDHGGYQADLERVAERLNRAWRASPGPRAAFAHAPAAYYRASDAAFADWLRSQGYGSAEIGTHAGLADTSLQLAVDPGSVRSDMLQRTPKPGRADGVYGDPSRASAELGRVGADRIVSETVAAIRTAVAHRR